MLYGTFVCGSHTDLRNMDQKSLREKFVFQTGTKMSGEKERDFKTKAKKAEKKHPEIGVEMKAGQMLKRPAFWLHLSGPRCCQPQALR